jgi:hypothetical protein
MINRRQEYGRPALRIDRLGCIGRRHHPSMRRHRPNVPVERLVEGEQVDD